MADVSGTKHWVFHATLLSGVVMLLLCCLWGFLTPPIIVEPKAFR